MVPHCCWLGVVAGMVFPFGCQGSVGFPHVQMLTLWACDLVHYPHTFVGQGFCLWGVPTRNVWCLWGGGTRPHHAHGKFLPAFLKFHRCKVGLCSFWPGSVSACLWAWQHALNTKAKVNTRNNLLRKLTNSRWGDHPATVRTTALALCFSTAEYACIVCSSWGRSRHTGLVDIALNDTCRIITGCLKATPIPCLYALAGIAPPHIRRKVAANADRCLQEDDPRHPLHGQRPAKHRLTSRNSFLDSTEALNTPKQDARTILWVEEWNALGERSTEWRDRGIIPNEHLASGTDEPWSTWRSLNRLRVQKGRFRAMMKMWKLSHTDVCDCGERRTMSNLMTCGDAPNCTWTDLAFPTLAGVNCAKHWEESI